MSLSRLIVLLLCSVVIIFLIWFAPSSKNKEESSGVINFYGTLDVTYQLTNDGYIDKVIIKDNEGTSVINSEEYLISFSLIDKDEVPKYELNPSNKTLKIFDSKYPSEKYK